MSQELKPCPFCGGADLRVGTRSIENAPGYHYTEYRIDHVPHLRQMCSASISGSTLDEVRAAWNKRAQPAGEAAIPGAPERIWLVLGDDLPDGVTFNELAESEICWCQDSQFEHDIEYVRADLAAPPAAANQDVPEFERTFQNAMTELVMRHIDRMNDVCEQDSAEAIIKSFTSQFDPIFDVYMDEKFSGRNDFHRRARGNGVVDGNGENNDA